MDLPMEFVDRHGQRATITRCHTRRQGRLPSGVVVGILCDTVLLLVVVDIPSVLQTMGTLYSGILVGKTLTTTEAG